MNVIVTRDYTDEVRKGDIIHDVKVLPYHYSGLIIKEGKPIFARIEKRYCETIKPINNESKQRKSRTS